MEISNGIAASFHDNSVHGEDTFLIRELGGNAAMDAVLDGVSQCEGGYASAFTAQVLQEATISGLDDLLDTLEQANGILFQTGRGRNILTTVSVALKLEHELHVVNSGDSPVYLIRGGEVRELTTIVKSGLLPGLSSGAVGLHEKLGYHHTKLTLEPSDRIVLSTDGLINNIHPEELLDIVQSAASPDEAVAALEGLVVEKRRLHIGREDSYGTFRVDDQTAVVRYFA